jgi:hypothetical protein
MADVEAALPEGTLFAAHSDEAQRVALRKLMIGHGALMIFTALLGGVGLWMFLLGGFEIIPGYIIQFQLPGTAEGWARAHAGPVMNGLMVIAIGFGLAVLSFTPKTTRILGWILIADGWANVLFYFFGNLSGNRGLAFGPSRMGHADVYSALALAPAYLFGALAMVALVIIGVRAIRDARL